MTIKIKRTIKKNKSPKRKWKLSPRQIEHRIHIKSDAWKKVKEKFRASEYYDGSCFICKRKYNLQIHHLTYERFKNENMNDLICLCSICHKNLHKAEKKGIYFSKIIDQLRDLGLATRSI